MKKITKLWGLLLIAPALLSFSQGETPSAADRDEVHRFIRNSWDKTVRFNTEDEGTRIGLPYRYTVPSNQRRSRRCTTGTPISPARG